MDLSTTDIGVSVGGQHGPIWDVVAFAAAVPGAARVPRLLCRSLARRLAAAACTRWPGSSLARRTRASVVVAPRLFHQLCKLFNRLCDRGVPRISPMPDLHHLQADAFGLLSILRHLLRELRCGIRLFPRVLLTCLLNATIDSPGGLRMATISLSIRAFTCARRNWPNDSKSTGLDSSVAPGPTRRRLLLRCLLRLQIRGDVPRRCPKSGLPTFGSAAGGDIAACTPKRAIAPALSPAGVLGPFCLSPALSFVSGLPTFGMT